MQTQRTASQRAALQLTRSVISVHDRQPCPQEKNAARPGLMRRTPKCKLIFCSFPLCLFLLRVWCSFPQSFPSVVDLSSSILPRAIFFVLISCYRLLASVFRPASALRPHQGIFAFNVFLHFLLIYLSSFFIVSESTPTLHILYILCIHRLSRRNLSLHFAPPLILLLSWLLGKMVNFRSCFQASYVLFSRFPLEIPRSDTT